MKFLVSPSIHYTLSYAQTNTILYKNLATKVRNTTPVYFIISLRRHTDITFQSQRLTQSHRPRNKHQYTPPTKQHNLTHLTPTDEWPANPLTIIHSILKAPSPSPQPTRFQFETSEEAAEHNWYVLSQEKDLGHAFSHDGQSPLSYGSEFRPTSLLQLLFTPSGPD